MAKNGKTDTFIRFSNFIAEHKLSGRAMNVAVFESIHSQSDCGDLFIRWIM